MEEVAINPPSSLYSMLFSSGPVAQSVLVILIVLSVWSWAITIAKVMQFRRVRSDSESFSNLFWETRNFARIDDMSRRFEASPLAQIFVSGYREFSHLLQEERAANDNDLRSVEQALKRAELEETKKLEKGVTFLASVASAAPFVGLFGTVWGIMNAFHGLSTAKSTTIQAVAPGISEALVATAIGLAAAIPAAVAYNYFVVAIKHFRQTMVSFSSDFINIARRNSPA